MSNYNLRIFNWAPIVAAGVLFGWFLCTYDAGDSAWAFLLSYFWLAVMQVAMQVRWSKQQEVLEQLEHEVETLKGMNDVQR